VSEMKKCKHCGTFVPAEKAFCPNCSEPMEEEETSNRAGSFSSDMMATIRDDPEKYRHLLEAAKKKKTAPPKVETPAPAPEAAPVPRPSPAPVTPPVVNYAAPPVVNYNVPEYAYPPVPVAKSNRRRNLLLGMSAVALLLLIFVLLVVFKVIDIGIFN
jgi:predicted nucleic acid-binding Zn ribbon protein